MLSRRVRGFGSTLIEILRKCKIWKECNRGGNWRERQRELQKSRAGASSQAILTNPHCMDRKTALESEAAGSGHLMRQRHGPGFVCTWIVCPSVNAKQVTPGQLVIGCLSPPPTPLPSPQNSHRGGFSLRFLLVFWLHTSEGLRTSVSNRIIFILKLGIVIAVGFLTILKLKVILLAFYLFVQIVHIEHSRKKYKECRSI